MKKKDPAACREKKVENLQKILRLNRRMNSTLHLDELLSIIMKTAEEVMDAEAASLLLLDENSKQLVFKVALGEKGGALIEKFRVNVGEGIAGCVANCGEPVMVEDVQKDPRFAKRFDDQTGFVTRSILCVPLKSQDKLLGVLEAINPRHHSGFCQEDLDLFEIFASQAAMSLERARMHEAILKQEKLNQELQIARSIQESFLPDFSTEKLGFDVAVKNIPARSVSGDFYDVLQLDENRLGVLIADVSGKGVPAALFMVNAVSQFRFLAAQSLPAHKLLEFLNQSLCQRATLGMFVTLLYGIIDITKNEMVLASAGHHPLLKRSAEGSIEELAVPTGIPIGLLPESTYESACYPLVTGDTCLLYTDGLIEARNPAGDAYEIERLKKSLSQQQNHAQDYADRLYQDLCSFTQDAPQHDDITMITWSL